MALQQCLHLWMGRLFQRHCWQALRFRTRLFRYGVREQARQPIIFSSCGVCGVWLYSLCGFCIIN